MKLTSIFVSAVTMLAATAVAASSNANADVQGLTWDTLNERYCCPVAACVRGGYNNVSLHHNFK
jgi:hypothetical protein